MYSCVEVSPLALGKFQQLLKSVKIINVFLSGLRLEFLRNGVVS